MDNLNKLSKRFQIKNKQNHCALTTKTSIYIARPGIFLGNHDRKQTYSLKIPTNLNCSTVINVAKFNFRVRMVPAPCEMLGIFVVKITTSYLCISLAIL